MEGRRRVLGPGNGPLTARLCVVATAPGRRGAERTGVPLSGDRSGENFDRLLRRAGLRRDEVFVTNAVLCNPQDAAGRNDEPSAAELARCREHLVATLALVEAPLVVAMGRTAFSALVAAHPGPRSFADCLARATPWAGRQLIATYHCGPRVTAHPQRSASLLAQWDAVAAAVSAAEAPRW
jgi:uracil-DNA glycosylase family 4